MVFLKHKYFLWLILSLPAIPIVSKFLQGGSGFEESLHFSGEFAARMMIIAMIATPLQLMFKQHKWPDWLKRNRRYFGVAAFAYAALHTLAYVIDMNSLQLMLDEFWSLGIWTGWFAFALFVPLAITSNNKSQRLLRAAWKRLQRLVYPAAVLTLVHWIFVHNNVAAAMVHFVPLAALELYRIYAQSRRQTLRKSTPHPT